MKLILSGDLHLGRTSTRVPELRREQARSLAGWERLVKATLQAEADVLLLSGDLIDAANRFWETSGPFERGIQTLTEAGVEVLAVSGNHDAAVLPMLKRSMNSPGFRLIGEDGQWERVTLEQHGTPVLHVDGWSFPSETVFEDPLSTYAPPPPDGVPVLGMVHGDPGVPDSRYAPLSLSRLQSAPVDGWLLGHVHKPSLQETAPWILMPGSPHPLDPGESGPHHAWSCDVENGKLTPPKPFCPATLRYEHLILELTADEIPSADQLRRRLREAVDTYGMEGHLVLRITLTGTTRYPDILQASLQGLQEDTSTAEWSIDRIDQRVHPDLPLEFVQQSGPVQALLVKAIQEGDVELQKQIEAVLNPIVHHSVFSGKDLPSLSSESVPFPQVLETLLRHSLPEAPES